MGLGSNNDQPFEVISHVDALTIDPDNAVMSEEEDRHNNREEDDIVISVSNSDNVWEHVDSSIHTVLLKNIWSDNAEDVCKTLDYLLWDSFHFYNLPADYEARAKRNIEIYYMLGGYSIMVALMHKWKTNAAIQISCCLILKSTCRNHPDLISHTVFAGAVDCIITALKKFPDRSDLQLFGVRALETFSNDDEYYAAQLIMKSGGLNVVLETMKACPNNDTILGSCCGLLYNLTYDEYIDMMKDAGVISLLATTMDQHKSNHDIQEMARKALLQILGE